MRKLSFILIVVLISSLMSSCVRTPMDACAPLTKPRENRGFSLSLKENLYDLSQAYYMNKFYSKFEFERNGGWKGVQKRAEKRKKENKKYSRKAAKGKW